MTCAAGNPNFFLLDSTAGWDADLSATQGLVGVNPLGCLALAAPAIQGQQVTEPVDLNQIVPYLPPAPLARGCGACEWYLVTPAPPTSLLLRRDACHTSWQQLWKGQPVSPLQNAVAVAVGRGRIAISERGANRVSVWAEHGMRQLAAIAIAAPGPLACNQRGEFFVTSASSPLIARYDAGGGSRGSFAATLPSGSVFAIAVDSRSIAVIILIKPLPWAHSKGKGTRMASISRYAARKHRLSGSEELTC